MKIKSFLKKLFLGEDLIARIPSSINGEIKLHEDLFGRRRIQVGQLTESGGAMDTIMEKALREVKRNKVGEIKSILLLGLGAGTIIKRLKKFWPSSKITAVELDPTMVEVGKKYFKFENIDGLEIIQTDAIELINNPNRLNNKNFDLIIVDLYLGIDFPTKPTMTDSFINGLKKISSPNGLVVINRLYWGKHKKETLEFVERYKSKFKKVWFKKSTSNLLVFCLD